MADREQWNESFSFGFVDPAKLTKNERAVFERTDEIMGLRGGRPAQVAEIWAVEVRGRTSPTTGRRRDAW